MSSSTPAAAANALSPGHSHYSVMVHYLGRAAAFQPTDAAAPPGLNAARQRLLELLPTLPAPQALDLPADPPPGDGDQALHDLFSALHLLAPLQAADPGNPRGGNPLGGETMAALNGVLEELAGQMTAALRQEAAAQVRGLYVIIDPEVTGGRDPLDIAQAAVRGGARLLQLRDKLRDKGQSLPLAQALQQLCEESGALLIVNDHADVAAAVGAGGLHVGQTDLPVDTARRLLYPRQILGRSNREIELLVESQEMGADYVAFGAIYPTGTKPGGRAPQGLDRLREARAAANVPLVAIGGITAETAGPVVAAGADAVCVTAAVGLAAEPEAAAAQLTAAIAAAGGNV